ncbi:Myb-like DNA-binding domain containing protein [Trichomonas vaginalis G3]|uniref:Myb-like DNA-binding domain containing protein n=1 Tax=Trichomonas vaginalis (strain ATCC PRA-98 / G3) TaxID=412133 RepID=A2G500_TRIV3|nr:RNA polymerase II transcription regulator recruiting protein [Trichomonas vaginalis G3]EAX87772.1 Myb-like DNA-binding domain containing protein [Trichomonas vaginalis G3]KAI5506131.1 RNA polymerase II transcription regulator recruiting protein [Trichomonas vaginalis G3]|eukprot:XP_001300702.1 Myb-like DNA-binding domain containing protein [Trichomonas vaginalis G3]
MRAPKILQQCTVGKPTVHRMRFTPEEDCLLTKLVSIDGINSLDKIVPYFPERNKRQLKERWTTFLSPDLRAEPFTLDEDQLLEHLINELGTKWSLIVKYFPGRTDVSLKNRWNMIQRQRKGSKKQNRKKITPQSSSPAPIVPKLVEENNDFEFFFDEVAMTSPENCYYE